MPGMTGPREYDAVVVGSGPNGLAAAVELARANRSVLVIEANERAGGCTESDELTRAGFVHDLCSAVHPLGALSPFFRSLPLEEHGLEWVTAPISVAHPLDDGRTALLSRDIDATAASLGGDGQRWKRFFRSFLSRPEALLDDLLGPPLRFPNRPWTMAAFGWHGLRSARRFAARRFDDELARGLFAGCAAHSILPMTHALTTAVGMVFTISAHLTDWPCAKGGSQAIAKALLGLLEALGGEIECGRRIRSLADLPPSRVVLFDTSPRALVEIAGDALPARYRRRLSRYRYGPAVFKVDWALDGEIPWADPACARASTVHVGGTLDEITSSEQAMWEGSISERPFLIVCQQSHFDAARAPAGQHTGYAYCHVPAGFDRDVTDLVEAQIERFAPGFRDRILARRSTSPADLERLSANNVGGAITGGIADLRQFVARPVLQRVPYRTPNPRLFLCSASTPPGGGVHGMCGYHAARAALKRLR